MLPTKAWRSLHNPPALNKNQEKVSNSEGRRKEDEEFYNKERERRQGRPEDEAHEKMRKVFGRQRNNKEIINALFPCPFLVHEYRVLSP
jgi:hypothetical protein